MGELERYRVSKKPKRSDFWQICQICEGSGCIERNFTGDFLKVGAKMCEECGGLGTIGWDQEDPNDMGSFCEECPACHGFGAHKDKNV